MKKRKRRVSIFTSHDWMKTLMWNQRNLEASSIFCCCINQSLASPIWDALHLLSEVCIKFTSSLPPDCRKRRIFGESLDNMRRFSSCVAAFMPQFSWKSFWCTCSWFRSFTFLSCFLSGAFLYFQFLLFSFCCRSVSPVPHKNSPLCPCEKNIFFDPPLQIFLLGFILKLEIQLWNAETYMTRNLEEGDLGNARKKTFFLGYHP